MAEASVMIKREIEDRLLLKHDLVKSNLQLLDDGFCVSWKDHEGAAYEARFAPWGMTIIIHARELLDGDQGAFVHIAAVMNKTFWDHDAQNPQARFSAEACASIYLRALRERDSEDSLSLTKFEDWEPQDKEVAKKEIKTTVAAAWVDHTKVNDLDDKVPEAMVRNS